MASLYNELDFMNTVDDIDVDRLSMPSSPTHPPRQRKGSINTVGSVGGDGGGGVGGGNDRGVGSLADELAALDYDDEEDEYGEGEEGGDDEGLEEDGDIEGGKWREEGKELEVVDEEEEEGQERVGELPGGVSEGGDVSHVDSVSGPTSRQRSSTTTSNRTISGHVRSKSKASTLSSPKSKRRSGTARPYNPDGDSEDDTLDDLKDGITYGLQERIDQIERLAMEGKKMKFGKSIWSNDGGVTAGYESQLYSIPHILHDDEAPDEVIPRFMDGLQRLQPQSTMETAVSRLTTAHSALASHMYNETRSLRELSFGLHWSHPPPEETADLLTDLIDLVPRPPLEPFHELLSLRLLTVQLVSQLSFISDSLHMVRQSSNAATRKLRVAREACAEWKGELEAAERGRKYIDEGDWVGKCSRREAAGVCVEVMEGFEKFCLGVEKDMQAMLMV